MQYTCKYKVGDRFYKYNPKDYTIQELTIDGIQFTRQNIITYIGSYPDGKQILILEHALADEWVTKERLINVMLKQWLELMGLEENKNFWFDIRNTILWNYDFDIYADDEV